MKKLPIILILILIILTIGIVFLVKTHQNNKEEALIEASRKEKEIPLSSVVIDKEIVNLSTGDIEEIKDIDKFLEAYDFTIIDAPVKDIILPSAKSKILQPAGQPCAKRSPDPAQYFKLLAIFFETDELEWIANRKIIQSIDKTLESRGRTTIGSIIEEIIPLNKRSERLHTYYRAILERNPAPIKDIEIHTASTVKTAEPEMTATEYAIKDISIYRTEESTSIDSALNKDRSDGYALQGALWSHEEEDFGMIIHEPSLSYAGYKPEPNTGILELENTNIPKPEKVFSRYDDDSKFPSHLFFFVYDHFVIYYAGGEYGITDMPRGVSAAFSTSLKAKQIDLKTIKYLHQKLQSLRYELPLVNKVERPSFVCGEGLIPPPKPLSATDAGFLSSNTPEVKEVQEIKNISGFLKASGFIMADTSIKEAILSGTRSEELRSYHQAILDKNSDPIKNFQATPSIFKTQELEWVATEDMAKNISIYQANKPESEENKGDGYVFHGALWNHEEENFGAILYWLSRSRPASKAGLVWRRRINIPKPKKIYSYHDAKYSPDYSFFFVYDEFITYYAGGYGGIEDSPGNITVAFSTPLQAQQVSPETIKYLHQKRRALRRDFLERTKK